MSKESLVFLFGFLVLMTPFLGIPGEWKRIVYIGAGIVLMFAGYSLRRSAYLRSIEREGGARESESFVEHLVDPSADTFNEHASRDTR